VSGVDDVVGETKLLIGKLDLGDDYFVTDHSKDSHCAARGYI
jgi:hypothetical protein